MSILEAVPCIWYSQYHCVWISKYRHRVLALAGELVSLAPFQGANAIPCPLGMDIEYHYHYFSCAFIGGYVDACNHNQGQIQSYRIIPVSLAALNLEYNAPRLLQRLLEWIYGALVVLLRSVGNRQRLKWSWC